MARRSRKAKVADVHEIASAMPHVTRWGDESRPVYQVGGKSFIFFRTPRPDAFDPETGERYADVIVFWVADEGEKTALVEDPDTPYFTTPHFNGHLSVLLRGVADRGAHPRRGRRAGAGRLAVRGRRPSGRESFWPR